MVSRDLTKVLNDQYPKEPETVTIANGTYPLSANELGDVALSATATTPAGDVGAVPQFTLP